MEMTCEWGDAYWKAVTVIEAQQYLLGIKLAQVPNMRRSDLQKWHRELHRQAYPKTYEPASAISSKEFAAQLKGMIHG